MPGGFEAMPGGFEAMPGGFGASGWSRQGRSLSALRVIRVGFVILRGDIHRYPPTVLADLDTRG